MTTQVRVLMVLLLLLAPGAHAKQASPPNQPTDIAGAILPPCTAAIEGTRYRVLDANSRYSCAAPFGISTAVANECTCENGVWKDDTPDLSKTWIIFDDFFEANSAWGATGSVVHGDTMWNQSATTGVVGFIAAAASGANGFSNVAKIDLGTMATGTYQLWKDSSGNYFPPGAIFKTRMRIEDASVAATNQYVVFTGLWDTTPSTLSWGIGFRYDPATSANWIAESRNGGVVQTTTTVPVVLTQFYELKVVCSSDGTKAAFFIDNVLVATHTSQIPSAHPGASYGYWGIEIQRTASAPATQRFYLDYFYARADR